MNLQIYLEDFKGVDETFSDDCEIITDRHTTKTYELNAEKRTTFSCVYGSPYKITSTKKYAFIVEMNNDTNMIEGIGYILNCPLEEKFELYSKETAYSEWNNYIYRGDYHISRYEFYNLYPDLLAQLEQKLFKGRTNRKRGKGLTKFSDSLYDSIFTCNTLISSIKDVFISKYF